MVCFGMVIVEVYFIYIYIYTYILYIIGVYFIGIKVCFIPKYFTM